MRHSVLFYFLIFFVLISLVGGSVFSTYSQFVSDGPLPERREIIIPRGASVKSVAALLKEHGMIESPSVFTLGVRASGNSNKIKAGEYSIPAHASNQVIMNLMTGGRTFVRRVVIPEGFTSYQIVEMLNNTSALEGEITRTPKNGTLLPETYHYTRGDTRMSIIERMENAMKRTLTELWPTRADGLPFKSPEEAVIMASIVEKETSIPAERPRIASVFLNRLERGMRLQSDPTVIFGITNGTGVLKRKLYYNDLKKRNPYNTYVVKGLPMGAISNPGRESIKAVLNPVSSNDLYFVADGTGGHTFSKTYEKHQEKVNAWRQVKRDKNALKQLKQQPKATHLPVPVQKPTDTELFESMENTQN